MINVLEHIDPQQEVFTALTKALRAKGYDVYDGLLPPDGTPYPFVYMGESMSSDKETKSGCYAVVTQTIHVYSNDVFKRGTLSALLLDIKQTCRTLKLTQFGINVTNVNQQILNDTTTATPLVHGILDVEFTVG